MTRIVTLGRVAFCIRARWRSPSLDKVRRACGARVVTDSLDRRQAANRREERTRRHSSRNDTRVRASESRQK